MQTPPGLDTSIFEAVIASGDVASRRKLAQALAYLTADPQTHQSDRDTVVPCILTLAVDPVAAVRQALALGLARSAKVHADIVFTILADEDEIALPFLAATPSLDPWMMAAIAKVGDAARQTQLARRGDVDSETAMELITRGEPEPCLALFDNPTFSFNPGHFRAIYERHGRRIEIVERLLACEDLPLDIRVLQAKRASNRIHQLMAERGWMAANDAAEVVADAEETAVLRILVNAERRELSPVIRFLTAQGMLTPSIIMRAACAGEMDIVLRALAYLAGMPPAKARHFLDGHGIATAKALFKKAGLPESCHGLLRAAADIAREWERDRTPFDAGEFGRQVIEALMTRYAEMPMPERTRLLDYVGRFAEDRVRTVAKRLKSDLVRAA